MRDCIGHFLQVHNLSYGIVTVVTFLAFILSGIFEASFNVLGVDADVVGIWNRALITLKGTEGSEKEKGYDKFVHNCIDNFDKIP